MPFRLLFACLLPFLLLTRSSRAQSTTVRGRTTARATGLPLSGCTILQLDTYNGVSSGIDGSFSLTVPGTLDSLSLVVTAIGYERQQRRVAASSMSKFALDSSKFTFCDLSVPLRFEAGLASGLRYTPLGATVDLYGPRLLRIPVSLRLSYQTNLGSSHAFTADMRLPSLAHRHRLQVNENVHYQDLRAAPANLQFRAASATVGLGVYRLGPVQVPDLLLGAGYGSWRPGQTKLAAQTGVGYTVGLRRHFGYPLRALVVAQATRWPGFWQVQGSVSRPVFGRFTAGIGYNQLRGYREVSVLLTRYFL
jgi:hypothetical protein